MECSTVSVVLVLLLLLHSLTYGGVINAPNTGYTKWPQNTILYRITGLGATDITSITDAMAQISQDSGNCITFSQYNPSTNIGQPFLSIQPRFSNPATPNDICWTYPGYNALAGGNGQVVTMFSSTSGNTAGNCLDSKRETMRVLMNALGVRNEYSRSDRDTYMTFSASIDRNTLMSTTLQKYNMFAPASRYSTLATTITTPGIFDYDSVTMVSGAKFAANAAAPVFTTTTAVGQLARLSLNDCTTLKNLYSCPATGTGVTPICLYSQTPAQTLAVGVPIANYNPPFGI